MDLTKFLTRYGIKNQNVNESTSLWGGYEFDYRNPIDYSTIVSAKSAGKQIVTLHVDLYLMDGMWRFDRECHFILNEKVSETIINKIKC